MGSAQYFALSVLLIFCFQGIHYLIKKRMYQFKSTFTPVTLAVVGALIFTIIERIFFEITKL